MCKLWDTTQSAHLLACSSLVLNNGGDINFITIVNDPNATPAPTPSPTPNQSPTPDVCAASVSSGDQAVGISAMVDSTCVNGGLGCFSATCRFCKMYDTAQSQYFLPCAGYKSSGTARLLSASSIEGAITEGAKAANNNMVLSALGVLGIVAVVAFAVARKKGERVAVQLVSPGKPSRKPSRQFSIMPDKSEKADKAGETETTQ
jgi:hypothetical protein